MDLTLRIRPGEPGNWRDWSAFRTIPMATNGTEVLPAFGGNVAFMVQGGTHGQYADGSWWTTGQITDMHPAFETGVTRTLANGTTVADTEVHGWRVNPGIAPETATTLGEKQTVNYGLGIGAGAIRQTYDSLVIGTNLDYDGTLRPALPIGGPCSVVKARSRIENVRTDGRPVLDNLAVCTIVAAAPPAGSLRPPLARADKTPILNVADIDTSKLGNLDSTGYAIPSFTASRDKLTALHTFEATYNAASGNIVGLNDVPPGSTMRYFGDVAHEIAQILLAMHFDAWSAQEKQEIAIRLAIWAQDIAARVYEGGLFYDNGGHSHGRLPVLAFCAELFDSAYLRDACALVVEGEQPSLSSGQNYPLGVSVFADNNHVGYVRQRDIDASQGVSPPLQPWPQEALGWPGYSQDLTRQDQDIPNQLGHRSSGYIGIATRSKPAEALALYLVGADHLASGQYRDFIDRFMGWWLTPGGQDPRYVQPLPSVDARWSSNQPPPWVVKAWENNVAGRTSYWNTAAPDLTLPTATATGENTMTGTVTTDDPGGRLYCVVTTSATAPTAEQIAAGQDHAGLGAAGGASQFVTEAGEQTVGVFTLAADTAYYAHYAQRSAMGLWSAVASSPAFSTDEAGPPAPFVARSALFDGATSLSRVPNVPLSDEGTVSMWFRWNGPTWGSSTARLLSVSTDVDATLHSLEVYTASGTGRLAIRLAPVSAWVFSGFAANTWHHLLFAWRSGAGGWFRRNTQGGAFVDHGSAIQSATLDLETDPISRITVGRRADLNLHRWPGEIGHLYVNLDEALDPETNYDKFVTPQGTPADLGPGGALPTGAPPTFYFDGDGPGWNNRTAQGLFTVDGALATGDPPRLP